MKVTLFSSLTALLILSGNALRAQSTYFSLYCAYPPAYEVGSAFSTHYTPGTLCFGYNSVVNVNGTWNDSRNFCVMGSGTSNIMASYKTFVSFDCNSAPTQIINQTGLSAVETNGTTGIRYAVAGTHDNGIYFVGLDNTGVVISQKSYPFSLEKSSRYMRPGKPKIIEGESSGVYYFCGSYDSDMYVLKIDAQGNLLWSAYYTLLDDTKPKDMIIDPFDPAKLIVIGTTNLEKKDNEGFLLNLSVNNGNVINCNLYGRAIGYDSFNTLEISHDQQTNAIDGFVIGGYQHPLGPGAPSAWILKMDQNQNIVWSNGIYTSTGINKGYVDIVERLNTAGQYEFYGLLESNAGMQVTKLDDLGLPFQAQLNVNLNGISLPKNEFIYDVPALVPSKATSLSYANAQVTGGPDVGLQIFGNSYFTPSFVGTYQVNSYFNGETNCYRTLTTLPGYKEAAYDKSSIGVLMHDVFTACPNLQVQAYFNSSAMTILCGGSSVNGSNLRPMHASTTTSSENSNEENVEAQVFPNPSTDKTNVNYLLPENSSSKLELFDLMGSLVYSGTEQTSGATKEVKQEINFENLGLAEGIYVLTLTVNNSVTKQKVVYRK